MQERRRGRPFRHTHTDFWEKSGSDEHEVSSTPLFWWLLSGAMKGIFVSDEAADE